MQKRTSLLFFLLLISGLLCITACARKNATVGIIGGADGPTAVFLSGNSETLPKLLQGTVEKIENGTMLITPVTGSPEHNRAGSILIPLEHMPSSPEPQPGDLVAVLYSGEIVQDPLPAHPEKVEHAEVFRKAVRIGIGGTTYRNTWENVPSAPGESCVEHIELPAGSSVPVEAFAKTEDVNCIVCLIGGEWFRFEAE